MSFEIEQRERDGVVVLAPKRRLVLGGTMEALRSTMERLLASGQTRVVLDLRDVDYIDSSGLGCLVMMHTRMEKAGGAMALFGLRQRQIELMIITKLATVFRLAEDEMDAVNACFPGRDAKRFDVLSFVASQKKDGGPA